MILRDHETILKLLCEPEGAARSDGEGAHRYAAFVACYKGRGGRAPLARLGECGSLRAALERLADAVAQRSGIEGADAGVRLSERLGLTVPDTDFARWLVDERRWAIPYLQRLSSPAHRFFAYWVLGWASGSFLFLETELADSAYVGPLCALYPAWRCVLGMVASPPHQDEAACILELPPKRRLGKQDKALLVACAAGELAAVEQALGAGAAVNGRDPDGNAPLHHAVAHRRTAIVRRLLAAGADPDLGAAEHDAPVFAGLSARGKVGPYTSRIEGPEHLELITLLLEHGASARAVRSDGRSLADLAAVGSPYPEDRVGSFLTRGAVPKALRSERPLHACMRQLVWRWQTDPWALVSELRLLLQAGADPDQQSPFGVPRGNTALHELLDRGYSASELDPAVIDAIVELFLRYGARPIRNAEGRTAADLAESWARRLPHYQSAAARLRAAHPT